MSHYENPIRLHVSFTRPDSAEVVLQGPALEAFYTWLETGDEQDHIEFTEKLLEQMEDHIIAWTHIDEWTHNC